MLYDCNGDVTVGYSAVMDYIIFRVIGFCGVVAE